MGCHTSKELTLKKKQMSLVRKKQKQSTKTDSTKNEDQESKRLSGSIEEIDIEITDRKPSQIIDKVLRLSQKVIEKYQMHELDAAFALLMSIKKDIKQLELRGYEVQAKGHLKEDFIELSKEITAEYKDMIMYDRKVKQSDWKLQKDKKSFRVSTIKEGTQIAILMETVLEVPFQNFLAVMVQPDNYKHFLPMVKVSEKVKNHARNNIIGHTEMAVPIIANRQSYFQGLLYNRLNHPKEQSREVFMFMRSIQNRKDIQERVGVKAEISPECESIEYEFCVLKYRPISQGKGEIKLAVRLDLKMNMIPMSLVELLSVTLSHDFYNNLIKISQNFKDSVWDQELRNDRELFRFAKKSIGKYLAEKNEKQSTEQNQ